MTDKKRPYKVGYGKPPKNTQFKPGQSGNPRGRAKKDKNPRIIHVDDLRNCILREFNRPIIVIENGKEMTLPAIAAILRQLKTQALKGNLWAMNKVLSLSKEAYIEDSAMRLQFMEIIADINDVREEKFKKKSRFDVLWDLYKKFSQRRDMRTLMGEDMVPYQPNEPVSDKDWEFFDAHLEAVRNNQPSQWPPAYWDEPEEGEEKK